MVVKKDADQTNDVEPEVIAAPTAEETLASLKQELEAKNAEVQKALSRMQGLEGSLKEKDRLLNSQKSQVELVSRIDGIEDAMQILAGMLSKGDMSPEDAHSYKQEFANLKKQREEASRQAEEARKQAETRARQEEYATQAQAVYAEAQILFKDNPEELERIEDALDLGKIERAKAKVARAKGTPKKVETPAEIEERVRKESKIESGELDAIGGKSTGGGGFTWEQVKKMSPAEYKKNQDEIDKLFPLGMNLTALK